MNVSNKALVGPTPTQTTILSIFKTIGIITTEFKQ